VGVAETVPLVDCRAFVAVATEADGWLTDGREVKEPETDMETVAVSVKDAVERGDEEMVDDDEGDAVIDEDAEVEGDTASERGPRETDGDIETDAVRVMESEDFGVAEPEEVEAAESDVRTVGETLAVMVAEEVMDVVREATADAVDEHTGSYQRPSMLHDTI
jgi:hypothetical protein